MTALFRHSGRDFLARHIVLTWLVPALLALTTLSASLTAQAAPTRLVADLSENRVDITSTYQGTELLLFGAYEGSEGDDIVLVVSGPQSDIKQRRKAKRAGIWVNVETVTWQQAPSFYHVFSTRNLDDIADRQALTDAGIGTASLNLQLVANKDRASGGHHGGRDTTSDEKASAKAGSDIQISNLDRNMTNIGLWANLPASIITQQNMLFRTTLALPSNAPTGDYLVRVVHFRDGVAISQRTTDMNIKKAGLSGLIYRFAHDYSLFYGLFAIAFAVASGWLAAVAFRR